MSFIPHFISYFNKGFKYVDENGKRTGMRFFPNVNLTDKLVLLAVDLRSQVQTLSLDGKIGDDRIDYARNAEEFIKVVKNAHESALQYRRDWNKKPSRFEKQLMAGLKCILNEFPNVLNSFSVGADFKKIDSSYDGLSDNLRLYLSFRENCTKLLSQIQSDIKSYKVEKDIQLPSLK